MPHLHALELVPGATGDEAVRRDWQVLHDAGLPSQLDHTRGTNTPHVTVLALPAIDAYLEARAAELLRPVLPVDVRTSGIAVLGGEKVTLARLLDVPPRLTHAVLALHDEAGGERHSSWLPHVTLGRRIPRADVQQALDLLGYADVALTLTALRRWDPERHEVRPL